MSTFSMAQAIKTGKRAHLYELAYFALDAGYSFYHSSLQTDAKRVHAVAVAMTERSGFDPDQDRLVGAMGTLDEADQMFVADWIKSGTFLDTPRSRLLHLLETAFDRNWFKAVGFDGRPAAVSALGTELVMQLSEVAEAHNALFCKLDENCETLLDKPVSPCDQRILTEMLAPSSIEDALGYLMYYVLVEDIQRRLAELSLEPQVLQQLETRMNARLSKGGPGAQRVSWTEALS